MNKQLFDLYNKDATCLKSKKLWLFDMDGTIYNEDTIFEGAIELFKKIEEGGGRYIFITNNSSKSMDDYIKKANLLGINASGNNFFTSTQATILYLKDKYPNKAIYCQGTGSMVKEMVESGINVVVDTNHIVDAVVVGFDTELTSKKLRDTCFLLQNDIPFIATNCDLRCPVSFGYIPDCGSICQMITNATGKKPVFIGKPEPTMVYYVMEKFGFSDDDTVVVGDRLYTDIATGNNAHVTSICVLTGEATLNDIEEGNIKPTYIFNSVKDIVL